MMAFLKYSKVLHCLMKIRKSNREVSPTILISQANEIFNELNSFDDYERINNTSLFAKDLNIWARGL